jgi:protein-S-isoprenylcysteine O-methyltransferase Ste14
MTHISSPGIGIYVAHGAFWGAFLIVRLIARAALGGNQAAASGTERAKKQDSAPFSRMLILIHSAGFWLLYFGLADAVFGTPSVALFDSQMVVGSIIIACGAALSCWALLHFRSWRLRASLDVGHELVTDGPFRFLRHPIYMALNLLALGSAVWIPTPVVWVGFVFVVLGSDLRARAEEALLRRSFGEQYANYCSRTRRYVPLIY